jgi:hypothetical protein
MESVSRQEEHALEELTSASPTDAEIKAVLSNFGVGQKSVVPSPSKGLFFEVCNKYTCLGNDILSKWCRKIVGRTESELVTYAKKRWAQHQSSEVPVSLSEEMLIPVQTLKDVTKVVESTMHQNLVDRWIKKLAVCLDEVRSSFCLCYDYEPNFYFYGFY